METNEKQLFVDRLNKKGRDNETKLQKQVQKYLNSIGAYCFKVHGSIYMKAGIPDIICCYKGFFIGIECKVGKNEMSELQKEHMKMILNAGGSFIEARTIDDVKQYFEKIFKKI